MSKDKTIFDRLRDDHDVQRKLLENLVETDANSEDRIRIFQNLKLELDEHAKYEERFFYNRLIESDLTQDKARHGISEHKDIDDLLDELGKIDQKSRSWLPAAKKLDEKVKHHLEEEEHEFFQIAGKELNEKEKIDLGKKYKKNMSDKISRY